jgi:hypothetical protein
MTSSNLFLKLKYNVTNLRLVGSTWFFLIKINQDRSCFFYNIKFSIVVSF